MAWWVRLADIRTIQFVTQQYSHLQGLRLVPLGVPFLVSAGWRAGWLRWVPWIEAIEAERGRGATFWFFAMLAVAVAVSFVIRRWYARRYGEVRLGLSENGAVSLLTFAACWAVVIWCQMRVVPPVSLPVLYVAAVIGSIGATRVRGGAHYLAVSAACVAYAALQPLGVGVPVREVLLDVLIGAGLIVAGLGDHRVLRDALATPEETHVGAV